MEIVAQLVRAPDCGSGGRGFETRLSPQVLKVDENRPFFMSDFYNYQLDLESIHFFFLLPKHIFRSDCQSITT